MKKGISKIFGVCALAACLAPGQVLAAQGPQQVECVKAEGDFTMKLERRADGAYTLIYSARGDDRLYKVNDFVLDDNLQCRFGAESPVLKCEGAEKTYMSAATGFSKSQPVTVKAFFSIDASHIDTVSVDGVSKDSVAVISYIEQDKNGTVYPRDAEGIGPWNDKKDLTFTPRVSASLPLNVCKVTPKP